MRPSRHVFVCTNRRHADASMPSAEPTAATGVLAGLLDQRAARGLYREIFVTETACLGVCPIAGATVVVYPEAVWYVGVAAGDVAEVFEQHLINGRPVARLLDSRFA